MSSSSTDDQHKRVSDRRAIDTRWSAALAAVAELVAWSDALDQARAMGYAQGRSEAAALEALGREREAQAHAMGYAEAVADMRRTDRGIAGVFREAAEVESGRWILRGEVRSRATFGKPHPADYRGGPVSWPELPREDPPASPTPTRSTRPPRSTRPARRRPARAEGEPRPTGPVGKIAADTSGQAA